VALIDDIPEEATICFEADSRLGALLAGIERYLLECEKFPHHCWGEHYRRVLRHSLILAREEKLDDERLPLLAAGALIHDIGYHFPGRKGKHFEESHAWALRHLPSYGYSDAEVESIAEAVLYHDHKLGEPRSDIGRILHDADALDKASIASRLFSIAVDRDHPLRREVAHKISSTADVARAYLSRMEALPDGGFYCTAAGRKYDAGRVELIKRVYEMYLEELEGRIGFGTEG
jgi:hypothetical protein